MHDGDRTIQKTGISPPQATLMHQNHWYSCRYGHRDILKDFYRCIIINVKHFLAFFGGLLVISLIHHEQGMIFTPPAGWGTSRFCPTQIGEGRGSLL